MRPTPALKVSPSPSFRGVGTASRQLPGESWISRFAPLGAAVAMVLIFLLLGVLLWLVDRDEQADHRDQLIRDALWVEQALQFQFESERARLTRLANDIAQNQMTPQTFALQARQYSQILPEIVDLAWLDDQLGIVAGVPQRIAGEASPLDVDLPMLAAQAVVGGSGAFTQPWVRSTGQAVVAYIAPIVRDNRKVGRVVAVFALDVVLAQHVPWWIAEKRAVSLKDGNGKSLATRSTIKPDDAASSHTIEMGAPLREMTLTLASYRQRARLTDNSLVAAMVMLGLFAAAGLAARERQLRKRRAAETALDDEQAFRKAMEDSLLVGIRARDLDGRLLYANQAFCRMVGYTVDELVGKPMPMPYWVPEQYELTRRVHDAVLAGQTIGQGIELKFQHRDGTKFDVLIYEAPLIDAQGVQRGWMGSVLDISDRKRAEEFARVQAERMQHTARLVTMGEMASLLAHDLNQPLAAISSYQTGLTNRLAMADLTREEVETALHAIGASAERAGVIVRRVHDFVKKREPKFETLALATVIDEALALLRPETNKMRVSPDVHVDPDLPTIRGDRVLLQQILVNLVRNGLDALATTPDDRRRIAIDARHIGATVEVAITDAGIGVPSALAKDLFQPFVSTKTGGMGMGLTICRSILELHGGGITHAPAADGGARFAFTLPTDEVKS
jgi:two-component system, LuxR family, sensor histidine kinase DctS